MKIAICITSHNRPEILEKTYQNITNFLPYGSNIEVRRFVVEDGNPDPMPRAAYSFDKTVGIPRSKNKCLELAYDWGADHIFLFDDDCYPIADYWWKPYIESPEPHLMYQFKIPGKPKGDMQELYRDDKIVAYSHTRGAMIYVERRVLDVIGGFDTDYGLAYFEHPDFSNRIYNAGLTSHRAMDVPNSSQLFYCLDQDGAVKSSIKQSSKSDWIKNARLYNERKHSKAYKEFM